MSRVPLALATAALALTLTACTSTPSAAISEDEFFSNVSELDSFQGASHDLLRGAGKSVCDVMDTADGTKGWVLAVKALTDEGFDAGDSGAFITYSTAAYCPDHMEDLPAS